MNYREKKKTQISIHSKDKLFNYTDPSYCTIPVRPEDLLMSSMKLKYMSLPFPFKNVTTKFGNTLTLTFENGVGGTLGTSPYTLVITFPIGYYTVSQLIGIINLVLSTDPVLVAAGAVFTFQTTVYGNKLDVTYNYGAGNVILTAGNLSNDSYVYQLLGLNFPNSLTVFSFTNSVTIQKIFAPKSCTESLPFDGILVTFEEMERTAFSSGGFSYHFYINMSDFKPEFDVNSSKSLTGSAKVWKELDNFIQEIEFPTVGKAYTLKNQTVRLSYSTDPSSLITEQCEGMDWNMLLEVCIYDKGSVY